MKNILSYQSDTVFKESEIKECIRNHVFNISNSHHKDVRKMMKYYDSIYDEQTYMTVHEAYQASSREFQIARVDHQEI